MALPTWVFDTSSLIAARSLFFRVERAAVMSALAIRVAEGE